MKRMALIFVTALALALSLPAAASQGKSKAKGRPATTGKSAEKAKKQSEGTREEAEEHAAQERAFGKKEREKIRRFFANPANLQGLPPGLAKRDQLPPGLQRHLEKNGTLPPGLQKRIQALPASLERQLPRRSDNVRRVVIGGNVILLEKRTSKILDIVEDVMGSRGKEPEAPTGVRRTDR